MSDRLTKRQRDILEFILRYLDEHGYQPSFRDIGEYFGIKSTRAVSDHINAIKRKGFLDTDPNRARSMMVTELAKKSLNKIRNGIRYLNLKAGYAAMSQFSATNDDNVTSYAFDENLISGEDTFILEARGDSMINAHITDGDMVIVNPAHFEPKNGDIVVARYDDEATVKRYFLEKEKNIIRLQPENNDYEPIFVHPGDEKFDLIGKVVGIYRKL